MSSDAISAQRKLQRIFLSRKREAASTVSLQARGTNTGRERKKAWRRRKEKGKNIRMRLYIMRHGETDWNRQGKIQGRADIPLNDNGRKLAQITAKRLQEIPFAAAVTSPLSRAAETARIIMGDRVAPVMADERIAELAFGKGEGMTAKKDGVYLPVFENFFCHPQRYVPLEGGETLPHLCRRTGEFLKDLSRRKEWKDQTILITTHGAAMRGLMITIRGERLENFWMGNLVRNCGVTIVDETDGVYTVVEDGKVYYE